MVSYYVAYFTNVTINWGMACALLAEQFIAYSVSSKPQQVYAQHIAYGPANRDAIKSLDAKTLSNLPNSPANGKNAVLQDAAFWTDYGDELEQRFASWASK